MDRFDSPSYTLGENEVEIAIFQELDKSSDYLPFESDLVEFVVYQYQSCKNDPNSSCDK